MSAFSYVVAALELGMVLTGLVLLWRLGLSPTARLQRTESPLEPWEAALPAFLLFFAFIFLATMVMALGAQMLSRTLGLTGDAFKIFNGAAGQFGMITGVIAYHFGVDRIRSSVTPIPAGAFSSGAVTFLVSLPILTAAGYAWEAFLRLSGLPADRQDLIRMFARADSVWLVVAMTVLAVIVAPVAEELVFRAGLFRYFRTRMPRSVAFAAPAVFFALLHVEWQTLEGFASVGPLVALAIVYSVAYERTGRIGTTIVAHALFNLNTIVMIFAGLGV